MAQQTALQGFIEALTSNGYVIINQTLIDTYLAMEKEQIINASSVSYSAGQGYHMLKNNKLPEQFAEQYYNITYNK